MNPKFQNFLNECANETLQRKRLKVMLARQERTRSAPLPSFLMCENDKIRIMNQVIDTLKSSFT